MRTRAGPVETASVTWAPRGIWLRAGGDTDATWPAGTAVEGRRTTVNVRPASRSACSAAGGDWRCSWGTEVEAGPAESLRTTVECLSARARGRGDWPTTRPLGCELWTRSTRTRKPASSARRAAVAWSRPTTLGTATWEWRPTTRNAAAAAPATRTATARIVAGRLRDRRGAAGGAGAVSAGGATAGASGAATGPAAAAPFGAAVPPSPASGRRI